jgi:hypothetical protein
METIVQLPDTGHIHEPSTQPLVHLGQAYPQAATQELIVPPDAIGKPGLAILESLSIFYCLTAEQLTRMLYSKGSVTYVRDNLRQLKKAELTEEMVPKKQVRFGTAPLVYRLSGAGRLELKKQGYPISTRYRAIEERLHKGDPLTHTLAVNDFLIRLPDPRL